MKKKPTYIFWKETYGFSKPNFFLKLEAKSTTECTKCGH